MENTQNMFIKDLAFILIEKLEVNATELRTCNNVEEKEYLKGQIFAYYDILDTIKNQALLFDIDIDFLQETNLLKYLENE